MSETSEQQALSDDQLDGVVGEAGEWQEGLTADLDHKFAVWAARLNSGPAPPGCALTTALPRSSP